MESQLIVAVLIRQSTELPLKKEYLPLRMDYLAGALLDPHHWLLGYSF